MCGTFALCAVTTILGMCASGLGNGVVNMLGTGLRQVIVLLPCFWLLLKTVGLPVAWSAMWLSETWRCSTACAASGGRSAKRWIPSCNSEPPGGLALYVGLLFCA